MATKKTEKPEVPEKSETELIVDALLGLQQQVNGTHPETRGVGQLATARALKALYARLGATLHE